MNAQFLPEAESVKMISLIDSHAHLDFPHYKQDLEAVLGRAREAGVQAILNAGTDEKSSRRCLELAKKYDFLFASAGIHPHSADKASSRWQEVLGSMAAADEVLAVGETGLDYYRDLSPRDIQKDVFRAHLDLAKQYNKPVIVHSRAANDDTLAIIRETGLPAAGGVMHCFSGSRQEAEQFLDLGMYISLAGPLTYPRSHELRELLHYIPTQRLLLETDAPYLSPQACRGKRNEPAFISFTYERAALELKVALPSLADNIYVNAARLFGDRLVDRPGPA